MTETRPHELSAACWCDPGPTSDDRFWVHSDGTAPERARDTGGLREALAFTHSAIHSGENCNGAVHDMVERALSQGAAHEERGLDVYVPQRDEAGYLDAEQARDTGEFGACPRCGTAVHNSANGWRRHEERFHVPEQARDTGGLRRAAENVSDRRTLMSDGFWVSRKEMRALDLALGRPDIGTALSQGAAHEERGLDVEQVIEAEHLWCVQVDGDYALRHEPEAHRRHAEFVIARLATPEAAPEEGQHSIAETPEDH